MNDLKFIKNFSKITITKACNECNVSRANLMSGRSKKENSYKVANYLKSELLKLMLEVELNDETNSEI